MPSKQHNKVVADDYGKRVPVTYLSFMTKIGIVKADGDSLHHQEERFGVTQKDAVDDLIENSFRFHDPAIARYFGNKGLPSERLSALRQLIINSNY